jgi:antitoxin component YwqK of YwqJK toxin-antitoxin module
MRSISLIALIFLTAPFVRVAVQDSQYRASHWPNGNPRSTMEARINLRGETIRDGRFQLFHENGALATEGRYKDDLEDGRWLRYTADGVLRAICDYEAGVGHFRALRPDGSVLREGKVVGETREGVWREYYPSGRLRLEGPYLDGEQHGVWTAYTDEDPPRSRTERFEHGEMVESD